MRIRVSGSTSATNSLSLPVSVTSLWSESNGVKWYELASTNLLVQSKCDFRDMTLNAEVSFDTYRKELGLFRVNLGRLIT